MDVGVTVVFEGVYDQAMAGINLAHEQVRRLPVSYAFGAGMVATVNPCGFIMLPSFAAFYLADGGAPSERAGGRLLRAAQMGLLITAAFVVTFGIVGALLTAGGRAVVAWTGWAGLLIGVALAALGVVHLLWRRPLLPGAFSRVRVARSTSVGGVLLFGTAYAVVSLGCTLPIFMAVAGGVFTGDGSYIASVQQFLHYALGMGVVLTVITVGVALIREQTVRLVSRALPYVEVVGNLALIFAGSYLVWYWAVPGGLI